MAFGERCRGGFVAETWFSSEEKDAQGRRGRDRSSSPRRRDPAGKEGSPRRRQPSRAKSRGHGLRRSGALRCGRAAAGRAGSRACLFVVDGALLLLKQRSRRAGSDSRGGPAGQRAARQVRASGKARGAPRLEVFWSRAAGVSRQGGQLACHLLQVTPRDGKVRPRREFRRGPPPAGPGVRQRQPCGHTRKSGGAGSRCRARRTRNGTPGDRTFRGRARRAISTGSREAGRGVRPARAQGAAPCLFLSGRQSGMESLRKRPKKYSIVHALRQGVKSPGF